MALTEDDIDPILENRRWLNRISDRVKSAKFTMIGKYQPPTKNSDTTKEPDIHKGKDHE